MLVVFHFQHDPEIHSSEGPCNEGVKTGEILPTWIHECVDN